jgi:hypothetical protein
MVVVLRCDYNSCAAMAAILAGFWSGMRILGGMEKGKKDWDSGFFGFFPNGIFIFGGFELGLGKCSGMQMGGGEGVAGSF